MQPPNSDVWTKYELDKPLANAEGGEAGIYTLKPHAGIQRVAKLYKPQSKQLLNPKAFASLAYLTSKYAEFSAPKILPFVAWPIEVLFTVKHPSSVQHLDTLAGITMRQVTGHGVLERITCTGFGRFDIGTETAVYLATTLASQIRKLHQHNIVFCDFNPNNVLISNDRKAITFVDADAYQHSILPHVFTKPHFFPGYASPDQIALKPGPRTAHDDNFVLAIHIFQLLLDGGHPFDTGPAYNPTSNPFHIVKPNDNISARRWPYCDPARYHPTGETPEHYAKLHPALKAMFERAFAHFQPPPAAEWEDVLPAFRSNVEAPPSLRPPRQTPKPHTTLAPHTPKPGKPSTVAKTTIKLTLPIVRTLMRWLWVAVRYLAQGLRRALSIARPHVLSGLRRLLCNQVTASSLALAVLIAAIAGYDVNPETKLIPVPPSGDIPTFITTTTPSPPIHEAALPPALQAAPPDTAPQSDEPEILPWLKPSASPHDDRRNTGKPYRYRRHVWRDDQPSRRGPTQFRLVPGGPPVLRITPTN